jgi:hypothetical protein
VSVEEGTITDTVYHDKEDAQAEEYDEEVDYIDTSAVNRHIEALIAGYNEHAKRYLLLNVETRGSEYNGVSTWLFDTKSSLKYYHEEWKMADSHGNRYCFFDKGTLIGIREEIFFEGGGKQFIIAFNDYAGADYYQQTADSQAEITPAGNTLLQNRTSEFLSALDQLIERIKNENVKYTEPNMVTVAYETNYDTDGGNMSSNTTATMPKELYYYLIKN